MKTTGILLACTLGLGLVASGCGGGSDDSSSNTTSTPAPTKAEFLQKGNAICEAGNAQLQADFEALGTNKPTQAQLEQVVTGKLVPSVEAQISDIRALGAPAGDEDQVKAILDAASAGIAKVKADPALIASNGGQDPLKQSNELANAYGLTSCGGSD
jgi:hypothetical protein